MSGAAEPLISVILAVFNGEEFLGAAIRSALDQTWPRTEVIVVDDGSTDESAAIASSYPVELLRQENRGVATARNRGLQAAGGELFCFLDQDDTYRPEKLARQLEALRSEPEAGISSCRMRVELEPGCPVPGWIDPDHIGRELHTPHLGTMLVWRRIFDRLGDFDEDYRWGSDTDWFMRTREARVPIVRVDDALFVYRVHDRNESGRAGIPVLQDALSAVHASVKRRRAGAGGG